MAIADRLLQTSLAINTNVVVSDVHRAVVKIQEGVGGKNLPVSVIYTPSTIESMFTVAQAQTRSAISTIDESSVLYLHLAYLVNPRPRHQGPVSDATS